MSDQRLGTYSNLYNHPTVIDDAPRRQIKLSQRSGLPVGFVGVKAPPLLDEEEDEEGEDDGRR